MRDKIKPFVAGTTFMVVFGIIDNLFLILGMEWLELIIPNINATVNGGIGNTISDAIGVVFGVAISTTVSKLLNVKEEATTFSQQLIGIIIGCLIPIIVYIIIITFKN